MEYDYLPFKDIFGKFPFSIQFYQKKLSPNPQNFGKVSSKTAKIQFFRNLEKIDDITHVQKSPGQSPIVGVFIFNVGDLMITYGTFSPKHSFFI